MDEKPKSIWKKSLKLPGLFSIWLGFMMAIMLICAIVIWLNNDVFNKPSDFIGLLIFGASVATILLCFWFFIRWVCHWRNFKRFVFGVACVVTVIALFYAEEDWRGKYDLEKFKRQWEAKGEKFNYSDFIPPCPPDDQNFALAPIVYSSYGQILTREGKEIPFKDRDTNFVSWLKMDIVHNYEESPKNGDWRIAKMSDLKVWRDYYRALAARTNEFPTAPQPQSPAADVLLALSKYDSAIEELREASKLPYSRFPIEYGKDDPAAILLPHLATLKQCSLALQLRAIAELQNGQSEKALDDVKLALYLVNSIRTEPFLISHLVRIAMTEITLQPIYEGLAECKWSDAQLTELDSELAKLDFLVDYEFSMRGEMIFGMTETEYLRRSRNFQALGYNENGSRNDAASHLGLRVAPASFFYRNELTIAQMHERWMLPIVDVINRIVSPKTVQQNNAAANKELQHGWPYNILARMFFPGVGSVVGKYAREQSSLDLARTAIALERFRLAHGKFPDSLDELAPQFIAKVPHDIINGRPLHYQREANGQFILYSVGWNETDDGGIVAHKKNSESPDFESGDWVWKYPQK